ncbi:MAG: hypothetical protein PWR03_1297 [Tenuifilum sp.]|nr:hypothetical protein [Tenuifilum sp.]
MKNEKYIFTMKNLLDARDKLTEAIALLDKALAEGNLNNIERNILLSKLSAVYDEVLLSVSSEPLPRQPEKEQKEVRAKQSIEIKKEETSDKKVSENTTTSKKVEKPRQIKTTSKSESSSPIPEVNANNTQGAEILADKYKGKRKFRDEVIAEHAQKVDMQSRLQNKPISDLSKAIGINDKFLFIKELFNGNSEHYNQTIKQLNTITDLNDAIIYLQENFDWDPNNETVVTFIDLVRRKFS